MVQGWEIFVDDCIVFFYFIEDFDTFASIKEAQNNMYDGVVYLIVFPLFGLYIKGGCVCRI